MGVALAIKPAARRHVSVLAFGLTQVAMDLEPLLGMLRTADTLHGWSHTLAGALLIATIISVASPRLLAQVNTFIHQKASELHIQWLLEADAPPRHAVWLGAMIGALSHLALDGLMHHDMHPLMPFSQINPLLGRVEHDDVYAACALAGVVGIVAWVIMRWKRRAGQGQDAA